ncbi:MAG: sigma 54-interacting transcriptional regulator [candidate division KSB1 bacterium]|nr:sigma 54-interacting transcriptional regulator [candidate division KSB1 bacterium]
MINCLLKKDLRLKLITVFAFAILAAVLIFVFSAHDWGFESILDVMFKIRGGRNVSRDIVLLYIDSESIEQLGGWPITRDYYAYMIYILKQAGARAVGFDILLDSPHRRYPEFDQALSEILQETDNVCLAMNFKHLTQNGPGLLLAQDLRTAVPGFQRYAQSGFSNLSSQSVIHRVPLLVAHQDSVYPSFALQLTRLMINPDLEYRFSGDVVLTLKDKQLRIPTDKHARLWLNHTGAAEHIPAQSFIQVMKTFQAHPDSLPFQNKCVIIGVTAPGAAPFKVTPLNPAAPAVFTQIAALDTILGRHYLHFSPAWLVWIITVCLSAVLLVLVRNSVRRMMLIGLVFFFYFALVLTGFVLWDWVLPVVPPAAVVSLLFPVFLIYNARQTGSRFFRHSESLRAAIREKQKYLNRALQNEQALQQQLDLQKKDLKQTNRDTKEQLESRKCEIERLQCELKDLKQAPAEEIPKHSLYPHIIRAPHSNMNSIIATIDKIKNETIPVFITGETGSGKEVIAQTIHQASPRAKKAFVAVNCGALSETLLESELFGHEKGAFTGAVQRRRGRFERADGGTLFLDEVTETTASFQAKLLRVLQEGVFERLGSEQTVSVNVRIIAASGRNMTELIKSGEFRQDLFYRLNGFPIHLPALRERPEDIPALARHFLQKYGHDSIKGFTERAREKLTTYRWPGNVRELENAMRRAAILAQSEKRALIRETDLQDLHTDTKPADISFASLDEQILEMLRSLEFSHASIKETAETLNKDRSTITEYFRGWCFKTLVDCDMNVEQAAFKLSDGNRAAQERVERKINDYLGRLSRSTGDYSPAFKGLPKAYHVYLEHIIETLD